MKGTRHCALWFINWSLTWLCGASFTGTGAIIGAVSDRSGVTAGAVSVVAGADSGLYLPL